LKSPFPIVSRVGDLRKFTDKSFESAIAIIADSYIEDLVTAIKSIKEFAPPTCAILVLIAGKPELHDLAGQLDGRTFITQIQEGVGWGEAANALLKFAPARYVIVMDPSTRFLGDAVTPTVQKLATGEWAAVGWHGGLVNTDDEWRSVEDKGPGPVDVLFSYFMGLNRESAIESGGFNIRALYYRNADMEFSLRLRQARGNLLQIDLPLEQARHHGYYDTDPTYRDEQSKKNYDRILDRFRGKNEILVERR
jgi:GT2 family glycosyltransferase